jgi:ParB-like chromosome segregation protein Spo0J
MKAHPYADILPLLEGEAFAALVTDIKANGLMEPITVHDGRILDGRNRWNACKAAGVEPRFLEFDGDDPLAFVLSLNLHRRHLSESQRGMVAARIETTKHGERADRARDANLHVLSRADAAKRLNVSSRTVASAAAVRDHASPELIKAVEQDKIAVSVAAELATAPEAIQRQAVAEPGRAHILVKQAARAERESELGAKQLALPAKRFGVVYADPPWRFEVYSEDTGQGRAAQTDAACLLNWGCPRSVADLGSEDADKWLSSEGKDAGSIGRVFCRRRDGAERGGFGPRQLQDGRLFLSSAASDYRQAIGGQPAGRKARRGR